MTKVLNTWTVRAGTQLSSGRSKLNT